MDASKNCSCLCRIITCKDILFRNSIKMSRIFNIVRWWSEIIFVFYLGKKTHWNTNSANCIFVNSRFKELKLNRLATFWNCQLYTIFRICHSVLVKMLREKACRHLAEKLCTTWPLSQNPFAPLVWGSKSRQ